MISIPTTAELNAAIIADLEAKLNITIPTSGKSALRAFAAVQAAKHKLIYLAIADLQKNIFADTADPESMGGTLERFGRVKLDRSPFAAVAGEYTVQVTGQTGQIIPALTTFKSDEDSQNPDMLFSLDTEFTLDGTNIITLRALTPGIEAQLSIGDTLTATAPIALVSSTVTVLTESIEPQAAEEIEEYRDKTLEAFRLEPQGGAPSDYRLWAADVNGVDQSYPYVVAGNSNQINLYVESIDNDGVPTQPILDAVQVSIEEPTVDRPSRLPLGVFQVNYLPVVLQQIAITVSSYTDLTAEKEALIEAEIIAALADIRPFIGGIDVLANKNDIISVNKIINLILQAVPGSVFGTVTMTVDGVPLSTYTFDNGEIPKLQSLTIS